MRKNISQLIKKSRWTILICLAVLFVYACQTDKTGQDEEYMIKGTQAREGDDPYLTEKYWALNNSSMQEKLRNVKPFPVGVVYYQQRGDNLDSAVSEFRTINKLGFTALKQVQLKAPYNPGDFTEKVFNAALDEGISPWYYGKGGWEKITQELVDRLAIDMKVNEENMKAIQEHPAMIEYQTEIMRERIVKMDEKPEKPEGMGEPGRNNPWMPQRLIPHFANWLENTYPSLDDLKKAWNIGFAAEDNFDSHQQAAMLLKGEGFDNYGRGQGQKSWDFRRYRDAMKFQSELIVDHYQKSMDLYTKWDPDEPERTGGHQLFENQAMNTWDLEGQAKAASTGGSFYASIHLTHHFFLVDNELTKPVYMQARTVADMFKGGWSATWESTGGPTWHSGYHPTTVDGDLMKQLMISYVAAGLKGIGFWMWNSRGEGWETGEYALCDVQGNPAERAVVAGKISSVLQDQRFELWESLDEPTVGVLYSWENEAMLGRISLGGYDLNTAVYETKWDAKIRQYHSEGRIGVARALMNNQIPYENVTERDLSAGLAQRYPVIYLPFVLALSDETVQQLKQYVEAGGRLVTDMPVLFIDNFGRLNKQRKGSDFEQLFGFQTKDLYHTGNQPKSFKGKELDSYFGDINITGGEVMETMDDGTPAVVKNKFGQGEVLTFNFEMSRSVFKPGCEQMEKILSYYSLGDIRPPFEVEDDDNTMVFRRAAPDADHYFFLNDGEEDELTVSSGVIDYSIAYDLIEDKEVTVTNNRFSLTVPAHSASWIRVEKK